MDKEKEDLLNVGMGILKSADTSKLKSVNVNATKRSDGSKIIAIELVYPEEVESKDYHINKGMVTPAQWGRILGY
ncbi:hypothetical protein ACT2B6_13835 [Candidatus Enterococcus leclercqii]